jgi:hypothetical protein
MYLDAAQIDASKRIIKLKFLMLKYYDVLIFALFKTSIFKRFKYLNHRNIPTK